MKIVEKFFLLLTVLVIALSLHWKSKVISLEQIEVHHFGDEGARTLDSVYFAKEGFEGSEKRGAHFWLDIHPPFDVLYRGTFLRIVNWACNDKCNLVVANQQLAVLHATLALALIAFFLSAYFSWIHLFFVITLLLGSQSFSHVSIRALGENTTLPFYTLAIVLLLRPFLKETVVNKDRVWIFASAFLVMICSLFRTEIVLILPGLCLALWTLSSFRIAVLYGLIASSFTVTKLLVSKIFFPEVVQYTQAANVWKHNTFSVLELLKTNYIREYFLKDFHLSIFVLGLGCLIIFCFYAKTRITKFAKAYWILVAVSVSYFVLVSMAVMFGYSHTQKRILIFFVIPWALFVGLFFPTLAILWKNRIKWLALAVTACLLLFMGQKNIQRIFDEQKAMTPARVVEFRHLLETKFANGDKVAFDYLYYWEWYLRAHLAQKTNSRDTCSYSRCYLEPNFQSETKAYTKDLKIPLEEVSLHHAEAHEFIMKNSPVYFVTLNKQEGQRRGLAAGLPEFSFINFYPESASDNQTSVFQIPFNGGTKIYAKKIYELAPYQVLKLQTQPF